MSLRASFDPNAASAPESGIFGLPCSADQSRVVLLPVPFEATTSYGKGTSYGPAAILSASKQVDLFDIETGRPYSEGMTMLDASPAVAEWNERAMAPSAPRAVVDDLCERMNGWVYETTREQLGKGKLVGAVGGDHSISFGCIRAHAEAYPDMGLLHIDAHADLREAFEGFTWSHASIMFNVLQRLPNVAKLVQVGVRDFCESEHALIASSNDRIATFFDAQLAAKRFAGTTWNQIVDAIVVQLPNQVYVSFDIDGLDPSLCPHTGTPVPGGLSFAEATTLLGGIVRSGRRIVGFDLVEVAPDSAGGEWDANVGARLLYKMIGWMLKSQDG